MVVLAIWLSLMGYAMVFAGLCKWEGGNLGLADAIIGKRDCTSGSSSSGTPTPVTPPGTTTVTIPGPRGPVSAGVTTDCTPRPGDTVIPGIGFYMIWRPLGTGTLGEVNGQLLGPCPGSPPSGGGGGPAHAAWLG